MLSVNVTQTLGTFHLNVAFDTDRGVTALFGRSGSGKSSVLRLIAGLARPDTGTVQFDDQVLADSGTGVYVAPHHRQFACVFQEARLFPHLTVRQNLHYGQWFAKRRGISNTEHIVEMLGIGHLLARRPAKLSGGEKQRVAIGRALLSSPRLLLMDEPLAALDDERKAEILPFLERMRDELRIPIIYVSHSVAEVARLADRVVLLQDGTVIANGVASDVLSGPSLIAAADRREIGSVLTGLVESIEVRYGLATVRLHGDALLVPSAGLMVGRAVRVRIPARDVMISTRAPEGLSALNVLAGTITDMRGDLDGMTNLSVRCGQDTVLARVTALSRDRLDLHLGKAVFAIVKTVALDHP